MSIANSPTYSPSGFNSSALTAGTEVEVEGTFVVSNGNTVLNARKIEIKQGTDIRMSGFVENVDATAKTLRLFGVTVTTNANTQFVNKLGQSGGAYELSDVSVGNFVEVRGYDNQAHTAMTAVTLERRTPDDRLEVRAIASNLNPSLLTFSLFGSINVNTAGVGSMPPGFFSTGGNDLVRVRDDAPTAWALPNFMADAVEIEEAR